MTRPSASSISLTIGFRAAILPRIVSTYSSTLPENKPVLARCRTMSRREQPGADTSTGSLYISL
jgi:hypothetical protein